MSDGGFAVIGGRPFKVSSSHQSRPSSVKHGYHVLSHKSSVDELLFSSNHASRLNEPTINFKPPWDQPKPQPHTFGNVKEKTDPKPPCQGRPLLWCPTPGTAIYMREKTKTRSSVDDSTYLWSTREHFRHLRHAPSFVDETLFGPKLEEPSFKAPWDVGKKTQNNKMKNFTSGATRNKEASVNDTVATETTPTSISIRRPESASGVSGHKNIETRSTKVTKPVWKP